MSKRRRRRNHYRFKRFIAGLFYLLILVAVVAALFYVIRDNRQKKADRIAYKESIANSEGDVQETLSVKTGSDETGILEKKENAEPTPVVTEEPTETPEAVPEETQAPEEPEVSPTEAPEVTAAPTQTPEQEAKEKASSIMILNGTNIPGVAAFWNTELQKAGYTALSMANYTGTVSANTVIYGDEAGAAGLKAMFPNAVFQPGTITTGIQDSNGKVYDFYIVVGTDDARNQ